MSLLDEDGRLFGKINVIDFGVLVIIALVLVAAARFTILRGQPVTVQAQVEMSDVPPSIAESVAIGATNADGDVRVTDVSKVDLEGGSKTVFAKVRLRAQEIDGTVRLDGQSVSPGSTIDLTIDGTTLPADVILLDQAPDLVPVVARTSQIFVAEEVSYSATLVPQEGMTGRFDSGTLFDIEQVARSPIGPSSASVYAVGEVFRYSRLPESNNPVSVSGPKMLNVGDARLSGRVEPVDAGNATVERTRTTVEATTSQFETTFEEKRGSPLGRQSRPVLKVGVSETIRETTTAEIVDFTILEAETVQPKEEQVLPSLGPSFRADVSLDLLTVEVEGVPIYRGQPLQPGELIDFRGAGTVFKAQITDVDPEPRTGNRTVRLLIEDVPPSAARHVDPGDVEAAGPNPPLLEVINVTSAPAQVTTTTEDGRIVLQDHPVLRDIRATVQVRTDGEGTFKDTRLVPGATVFVRPDGIPLDAKILEVGA